MQSRWLNVLGHVAWWQSKSGAVITNLLILTGIQSELFNTLNCASCEHGCLATLQYRLMMHFGFLLVLQQQVCKHCPCWCAATTLIALTLYSLAEGVSHTTIQTTTHSKPVGARPHYTRGFGFLSSEIGDNHKKLNKRPLLTLRSICWYLSSIYLSTKSRAFCFRLMGAKGEKQSQQQL